MIAKKKLDYAIIWKSSKTLPCQNYLTQYNGFFYGSVIYKVRNREKRKTCILKNKKSHCMVRTHFFPVFCLWESVLSVFRPIKGDSNNFKENTEQKTMQLQTVSVLCILYILPCCWFSLVSIAMGILDRKWEIYMKRLYTNCSPPFTKYNTLRESFMMYCVVWLTLGKCNPFGLFQV